MAKVDFLLTDSSVSANVEFEILLYWDNGFSSLRKILQIYASPGLSGRTLLNIGAKFIRKGVEMDLSTDSGMHSSEIFFIDNGLPEILSLKARRKETIGFKHLSFLCTLEIERKGVKYKVHNTRFFNSKNL